MPKKKKLVRKREPASLQPITTTSAASTGSIANVEVNQYVRSVRELISWEIYDRVPLPLGVIALSTDRSGNAKAELSCPNRVCLFQQPIGQGGKTYLHTNMLIGGMLPHPQIFRVRAIRAELLDSNSRLWGEDRLVNACSFSLTVCNKLYLQLPLPALILRDGNYYRLEHEIKIESGELISATVEIGLTLPPEHRLEVLVRLFGELERNVN